MGAVPCNGCRTCCRDQAIVLVDEDMPNLAVFDFHLLPGDGPMIRILNLRPDGNCVHLGESGCTIYEQRPMVCREYDCRKQFSIMSRNERRQFKNEQIWEEARKRLPTLDAEDIADISAYRERAANGWKKITLTGSGKP